MPSLFVKRVAGTVFNFVPGNLHPLMDNFKYPIICRKKIGDTQQFQKFITSSRNSHDNYNVNRWKL